MSLLLHLSQRRLEHPGKETTAETDDEKLRQLKAEMKEKFKKLGITTKEKEAYLSEHFKMKGDKPTVQELTGLLKMMDLSYTREAVRG
ncbi:hypothetical protein P7H19_15955 [Paenibacillus larvae]|nr:hypothetical protein [Paenibacillus larvae]MDT2237464.1 hypothetical protein [Paenibacillus larvae]